MNFNPIKTGRELKAARVKRGLSQEDLEEETGVSQTAIGDIELGKRKKSGHKPFSYCGFSATPCPRWELKSILIPQRLPRVLELWAIISAGQ